MGKLLDKLFGKGKSKEKNKIVYDTNAPISEYTEEQIIARIEAEIPTGNTAKSDAGFQYESLWDIENGEIKFCYVDCFCKGHCESINDEYFLNDFFREAVLAKAKKMIYDELKNQKYSKENLSKMSITRNKELTTAIENHIKRAKETLSTPKENSEDKPIFDAMFRDLI